MTMNFDEFLSEREPFDTSEMTSRNGGGFSLAKARLFHEQRERTLVLVMRTSNKRVQATLYPRA
jgi:hypothetical protein